MKLAENNLLRSPAVILLLLAVVILWILPTRQNPNDWHLQHQQFLDFQSAVRPIIQSDPKFENVYCGLYTGGRRGCLGGFVDSTNDLERIRQIYSMMLSNHPARVEFSVKIEEHIFN